MTLITSVWNKKFNILCADTRLTKRRGIETPTYDDSQRKIFVGEKFAIGVHGVVATKERKYCPDDLNQFVRQNFSSRYKLTVFNLYEYFQQVDPNLKINFILNGKKYQRLYSYYIDNYYEEIIADSEIVSKVMKHNFRFNCNGKHSVSTGYETGFSEKLTNLCKNRFWMIFKQEIGEYGATWKSFDDVSYSQFMKVLNRFYDEIINDSSELTHMIGGKMEFVTFHKYGQIESNFL